MTQYKVLCLPFVRWTLVARMSSFTFFRTKYVTYLKTFWCKFLMRVLMLDFEILSLVTFFFIECLCMAPLTPYVMVMWGFIFHRYFVGC